MTVQSQLRSLNGSIILPMSKKQFCQVISIRPVHSLKVFQLSSDVNCHPILQQNLKSISCNAKSQQQNLPKEERFFLFCRC